jgi:hypothetical protein
VPPFLHQAPICLMPQRLPHCQRLLYAHARHGNPCQEGPWGTVHICLMRFLLFQSHSNHVCTIHPDQDSVATIIDDDGSDVIDWATSSEDEDNIHVSDYRMSHLHLKCIVHGSNHCTVVVNTFLDNGTYLVLINPNLVHQLKLKVCKLPQPESFGAALQTSQLHKTRATKFVYLHISTMDNVWTSKKVITLILPSLNMPVLLGLPFLAKNKLVIDHDHRTCFVWGTNIDLLQLRTPLSHQNSNSALSASSDLIVIVEPNVTAPSESIATTKLKVLVELSRWYHHCHQTSHETAPNATIIQHAINAIIAKLELDDNLRKLEANLRQEFKHIFKPIPHVDQLPMDVIARIKLKDSVKTITTCSYASPKKYQEAWSILIQHHLDAGRIRPSASPFASPAFLTPKTDPTVLP